MSTHSLLEWFTTSDKKNNRVPKVDLHQNNRFCQPTSCIDLEFLTYCTFYINWALSILSIKLPWRNIHIILFFQQLFGTVRMKTVKHHLNIFEPAEPTCEAFLRVSKPLKWKTDNTGQFLPSPTAKGLGFTQLDPWIGSVIIYVQTHLVRSIHIIHIHLTVHIADIPIDPLNYSALSQYIPLIVHPHLYSCMVSAPLAMRTKSP